MSSDLPVLIAFIAFSSSSIVSIFGGMFL
jgi:hypothetical protein